MNPLAVQHWSASVFTSATTIVWRGGAAAREAPVPAAVTPTDPGPSGAAESSSRISIYA